MRAADATDPLRALARPRALAGRRRRVAVYSPDGFGLGHLRRTMLIAHRLLQQPEIDDILLITGSPVAQRFPVADGIGVVTLPAVTKDDEGRYVGRSLHLPIEQLLRLRGRIAAEALASFGPDLLLVDHTPTGLAGELRPVLARYHAMLDRPHLVYGMREIIDDVVAVRREWDRLGCCDAITHWYDRVLVYGDPALITTADELGLERIAPGAVRHVGYVARPMPARVAPRSGESPAVLVTVGGGADGETLLQRYAENLGRLGPDPGFLSRIVTGPLLDRRSVEDLRARLAASGAPFELVEFTDRLESLMAEASAVISMGGYNSVVELLGVGVPTLVVPRHHFRREQELRAQRLADTGMIDWETIDHFDARRLRTFVQGALRTAQRTNPLDMNGLDGIANEVVSLLRSPMRRVSHQRAAAITGAAS